MRKTQSKRTPRKAEQPKPAAVQPDSTPKPVAAPDWANVTPDDNDYKLIMFLSSGIGEQEIKLSREEFVLAKRVVAAKRGYELLAPRDEYTSGHCNELQKIEITQDDIQMVMDLENVVSFLISNIRRRLKDGATIEDGDWQLRDDESEIERGQIGSLDRDGLRIGSAEEEEFATGS